MRNFLRQRRFPFAPVFPPFALTLLALTSVATFALALTAAAQTPSAQQAPELGAPAQSQPPAEAATGDFVGRMVTVNQVAPDRSIVNHSLGTQLIASSGTSFNGSAFTVTVNGSQIVVSNPGSATQTYAPVPFNGYQIAIKGGFDLAPDPDPPKIAGITIHETTNGFDSSRIAFDAANIYLNFQGLSSPPGVDVIFDVQFAPASSASHFPTSHGVYGPAPNASTAPAIPSSGLNGYGVPKCIHCPDAKFSQEAIKAKYAGGTVIVSAIVGLDGRASDVHVIQALGLGLDQNAIAALKKWRFTPALGPDGKPAAVRTTIEFTFHLY